MRTHSEKHRPAAVSLAKLKSERAFAQLPGFVRGIPRMTEDELLEGIRGASVLGEFAFLQRGACASELQKRLKRLPGGRGKKDLEGAGMQSRLDALSAQIGISRKTLQTDARIVETFYPAINETTLEQLPPLEREYYAVALSAPDPLQAIRLAVEGRAADPSYSLRRFRAQVHALRAGGPASGAAEVKNSKFTLKARVSAETFELLAELQAGYGISTDLIVERAIQQMHASQPKPTRRMLHTSKSQQGGATPREETQLKLDLR